MTPTREPSVAVDVASRYALYLADLNREATDSHGIINYALSLVEWIPRLLSENESLLVYANESLRGELARSGAEFRMTPVPSTVAARLWNDNMSWRRAHRDGVDVIHYPKGYIPLRVGSRPVVIATLHDDIALQYAERRWKHPQPRKLRYFAWQTRHAIRKADVVLTDSQFSKQKIIDWSSRLGRNALDPVVTLLGPTTSATPNPPRGGTRYFLLFGSRYPHKRASEALEFTLRYLDQKAMPAQVRVIGAVEGPTHPRVMAAKSGLPGSEVSRMIAGAASVVTASEYEGFGLAPLDAWNVGTPAVFAKSAAALELFHWLPGGFLPGHFDSFTSAMDAVLSLDPDRTMALAGEARRRFDWEDVAARVLAAYRMAASEKQPSQRARRPGS